MFFGISVLSVLVVKTWHLGDKILYETNLEMGWSVHDRVGFLSSIGNSEDLGDSRLSSIGVGSWIFGSINGSNSLGT